VQVDRLATSQPLEKVVHEGRQTAGVRRPTEVGNRVAEDCERRRVVRRDELRRHLVVVEQARDRRDTSVDQRRKPCAERPRGPRPADEPARRRQDRVDDRDHAYR
jgi:hypothetical protein